MTGINKAPITLNIESYMIQARADVQPQPLGKGRIIAVIIQNRLNNLDDTGNNVEIMWGFGPACLWQTIPGQESPVIYANDLEDIFMRVRTGNTAVDVPVLVYREKGSKKQ